MKFALQYGTFLALGASASLVGERLSTGTWVLLAGTVAVTIVRFSAIQLWVLFEAAVSGCEN